MRKVASATGAPHRTPVLSSAKLMRLHLAHQTPVAARAIPTIFSQCKRSRQRLALSHQTQVTDRITPTVLTQYERSRERLVLSFRTPVTDRVTPTMFTQCERSRMRLAQRRQSVIELDQQVLSSTKCHTRRQSLIESYQQFLATERSLVRLALAQRTPVDDSFVQTLYFR
jgi:hypothetical protein